jgi:hypothetical protein
MHNEKSTYAERARAIHGKKYVPQTVPDVDMSANEYWKKNVRTSEDVLRYYDMFYPHYTREMKLSIVHYFNRIVAGEVELPTYLK